METKKILAKYRQHLRQRGLRPTTVKNYSWHVAKFYDYLDTREITLPLLKKYQTQLLATSKNVGSLNLHFIIINDYLRFAKIKFRFTLLSNQLPEIKILTQRQLDNFLQAPLAQAGLIGRRDQVLLEILYHTGLKVGKIIMLQRQDIDRVKQEIFIDNQNIALNPLLWSALEKYLNLRHDKSPWLFINLDRAKKNIAHNHLTVRSVERIIDKYARRLRPPLLITPQILRNTLGHRLKREGGRNQEIQTALHLQNPKATKKYWQRL